jgi:serine/threonine protein kinase
MMAKDDVFSLVGRQVGDYQVLSFIAEGGQAKVFRARDQKLGREAAIKVLPEELSANQQVISRLEKEACLASSLNHPNIVTIYGIHRDDSALFIAMELVDGRTLHDILRDGPMPLPTIVKLASQITAGLSKAHQAGIVHRDLKSRNIMINRDGIAKILDFGLGKLVLPDVQPVADRPTTASTLSGASLGAVVGTVDYMSPQQANGQPVDFRSDQFSFGVLLYEMIAGRLPFQRATVVQTLASIIEDEPEAINKMNPKVPACLQTIVERCLAKNPESRYASTSDLAKDLRVLDDGLLKKRQRPRMQKIGAAILLMAILLAGIGGLFNPWIQKSFRRLFSLTPLEIQLAVLPFTNVDNDPANQAFCAGIAEILTTKLSQLQQFHDNLRVVPASEIREASVSSVRDARKAFGVTMAITGSILRTSKGILMTINLVDAATLRQLDGRSMDAATRDAAVLQDGVLLKVAELLEMKLTRRAKQVVSAGGTEVRRAYEFYVTGRGYLQHFDDIANVDQAISFFERALKEDPQYALAYAGLGEAYWHKYGPTKDAKWVEEAVRYCQKALKFDNHLAEVAVTLGIRGCG